MRRTVVPELLDNDLGTAQEIADGLADLRGINRRFGGHATTISLLHKVAARKSLRELRILDVAGASGDTMREAQRVLASEGVRVEAALLDINPTHMAARGEVAALAGNAMRLPLADNSFDVVSCALFMHHLEPREIAAFLRSALRVARHAVVINDLKRSYLHLAAVYLGMPGYKSRLTRHDAPVSIRRSYTKDEMLEMIRGVHTGEVEMSDHFLFRMGAILWK